LFYDFYESSSLSVVVGGFLYFESPPPPR
jgi:hypothetical protein